MVSTYAKFRFAIDTSFIIFENVEENFDLLNIDMQNVHWEGVTMCLSSWHIGTFAPVAGLPSLFCLNAFHVSVFVVVVVDERPSIY